MCQVYNLDIFLNFEVSLHISRTKGRRNGRNEIYTPLSYLVLTRKKSPFSSESLQITRPDLRQERPVAAPFEYAIFMSIVEDNGLMKSFENVLLDPQSGLYKLQGLYSDSL